MIDGPLGPEFGDPQLRVRVMQIDVEDGVIISPRDRDLGLGIVRIEIRDGRRTAASDKADLFDARRIVIVIVLRDLLDLFGSDTEVFAIGRVVHGLRGSEEVQILRGREELAGLPIADGEEVIGIMGAVVEVDPPTLDDGDFGPTVEIKIADRGIAIAAATRIGIRREVGIGARVFAVAIILKRRKAEAELAALLFNLGCVFERHVSADDLELTVKVEICRGRVVARVVVSESLRTEGAAGLMR